MRFRLALPLLLGALAVPTAADAQLITRPHLSWSTIETTHFIVHYPRELERWTLEVVAQLESVHAAVIAAVGSSPPGRTTVIVEDPLNVANGFAIPDVDRPIIVLFPTPPTPQSLIGTHRGWGELLAVHEYAHIAHLARPSRNPWQRRLWRTLPIHLGPITRRSPRWAIEGYATYLEGRLTGSGRPHGTGRPAVLRQWALEGQLPQYQQLDGTRGYLGGAMAYLVGSAFLEWLVERRGEESLQHLWRRMTARQDRSFAEAFAGVYGAPPDELYGRFTAELTGHALDVERTLADAETVPGEKVQRLGERTGDPAISPDGRYVALVLRRRDHPSRLVVWRTEPDTVTDEERRRRREQLERDPEDVPAVEWRPRPRTAVATLFPAAGRPHDHPRFLPDGRRILVTRPEALSDGAVRPDLFIWNFETGALRRVTRGAAIRYADPSPDGSTAVADRCLGGICDLVTVSLETGDVRVLVEGSTATPFYRPRYSRDGRMVAVSLQREGRWRVALVDPHTGAVSELGPDDGAQRFDPSFMPDGRSIVVVSEHGGITNLELIDIRTGEVRPLTRVTGGVLAPAPNPGTGALFFLHLHARGLDLHRLHPDSADISQVVMTDAARAPATRRPAAEAPPFRAAELPRPRGYGLGPRVHRLLPGAIFSPEGSGGTAVLIAADPVGRLTWVLQGSAGERGLWRGGGAAATWRGTRPWFSGELFAAGQRPSAQQRGEVVLDALDVDYAGSALHTVLSIDGIARHVLVRFGGSLGRLEHAGESVMRSVAFVDTEGSSRFTMGLWELSAGAAISGGTGRTGEDSWTRAVGTFQSGLSRRATGVWASVTHGVVNQDAPAFEQLIVGGNEPHLFDRALLTQRLAMPALPLGVTGGRRVTTLRFATAADGGFYYWMARAGDDDGWRRVWGLDAQLELPPIPLLALSGVRLRSGLAYSLDEPFRRRVSSHLALTYRP